VKFYNLCSPDDETSSKQENEENLTNLTKEMQKFGRAVFEICARTDRHADTHADRDTSHLSKPQPRIRVTQMAQYAALSLE